MKQRTIKPVPLTAKAFAPYGDVIECKGKGRSINYGNTVCFDDLATLDVSKEKGKPQVRFFRTTPLKRPIQIKLMERHPLSSQAFYPLSGRPYLVVVAKKGKFDPKKIKVFLAGPKQGVNYHAGTWHHFSLALDKVSEFLVIDRAGPGKNCDEAALEGADRLCIDY